MCPSCNIYQGDFICEDDYIGETKQSTRTRCDDYNNPMDDSEPQQHLETT